MITQKRQNGLDYHRWDFISPEMAALNFYNLYLQDPAQVIAEGHAVYCGPVPERRILAAVVATPKTESAEDTEDTTQLNLL